MSPLDLHRFILGALALVTLAGVVSCSQQAGRWELSFEGEAVKDDHYEVRLGDDVVSVPITKGDTAQNRRDRFVGALRDSGYSVDCIWNEPSQSIAIVNGTLVPPQGEAYFALAELPGEPESESPHGRRIAASGPRESRQEEVNGARNAAVRWIEDLAEAFNPPSSKPIGSLTRDGHLLVLLAELRGQGKPFEPGTGGVVSVDCNQAEVELDGGSIASVVLERGYYQHWWQVTDVNVSH